LSKRNDNLLGVIETIFAWKKEIIIVCAIAFVGSAIVAMLKTVYYEASTTFYAASPDLAAPEFIFGGVSDAMEYYGKDSDIDRVLSIGKSGELAQYLINKYDLYNHYDVDTADMKAPYYVRLIYDDLINIKQNKYDAIVFSVEDEDRELAATIANDARGKIDEIGQRMIKESQKKVLDTYRANIQEKQNALAILNDSLENTREKYGVFNTETQGQVLSSSLGNARARLERDLSRMEAFKGLGGRWRDSVNYLKAVTTAIGNEVAVLQSRLEKFNAGLAPVDVLQQLHEEAREKLGEEQERYKQINTVYNSYFPTIHVSEPASIPVIKSRPLRTLIVVVSTLIAFILSVIGVLILDTYKHVNWRAIVNAKK